MGIWQRLRGVESRQAGGSYTDALVQLIQSREAGSSALPGATSALECASGFVSRAFASADVTTGNSILAAALDPLTLSTIGRALVRSGRISGRYPNGSGRRRTSPCSGVFVGRSRRAPDPETWVYRCTIPGPGRQSSFENVPAAGVVHIRAQVDPQAPWRGIGPLQAASLSGRLSAEISLALADEFSGPRGQLLPLPNVGGESEQISALKADLRALRGHLAFVESQSDSFGTGPTNSASSGWDSKRIGAKVPDSSIRAAQLAFSEVLAAVGLSVALFDGSQGTAKRESYRQALHSTIAPLGRIAAAELSAKLETSVRFDWAELRAGDISGRARAAKAMVESGMDLAKAMALSGLMITEED